MKATTYDLGTRIVVIASKGPASRRDPRMEIKEVNACKDVAVLSVAGCCRTSRRVIAR